MLHSIACGHVGWPPQDVLVSAASYLLSLKPCVANFVRLDHKVLLLLNNINLSASSIFRCMVMIVTDDVTV